MVIERMLTHVLKRSHQALQPRTTLLQGKDEWLIVLCSYSYSCRQCKHTE